MHLLKDEPTTIEDLRKELASLPDTPSDYSVAVEGLVFDETAQWILMHRGDKAGDEVGKLEGIGGRFD